MTSDRVCAIFTTFRPGSEVVANLVAVRSQVQQLVVVDNGSVSGTIEHIVRASEELNFHIIKNETNLGIATAMNLGAEWASRHECDLLLFFDQDSTATDGMVDALLRRYRMESSGLPIGLVATTNTERTSGAFELPLHDSHANPVLAMTSGSMIPLSVFTACGPFEDDFFIEFVDHEYCLRLRSKGYRIALCSEARLIHDVGFPRTHSIFGLLKVRCTHHHPNRRYYFVRNLTVLLLRYWRREPLWCRVEFIALVKSTAKILFFEKRRGQKVFMSFRGIWDGLRNRMGERVPL